MKEAIKQAKKAASIGEVPIGCVIVYKDKIIGRGYNRRMTDKNALSHAELNAIKKANKVLDDWRLDDCEMYVTTEPCQMCAGAIVQARVKKVYIGCMNPKAGCAGSIMNLFNVDAFNHQVESENGILEEECRQLNDIFFHYIQNDIPYTALKYAMTLDGKIATATGESKWITGEEARRHAHTLRHQYAAIMAGIGTVLADDPMLNARIEHGNDPIRVICDSNLRISEESNIVKTAREIPTIIATIREDQEKIAKLEQKGCKILKTSEQDGKVNVKEVLKQLRNMEIDSVLVEGGGILNESLIKNDCVHKVYAYIAPKLFGGEKAKTPVEGKGIERIQEALVFDELKATPLGNDILLEGKVRSCLPES